MKLLRMKGTSAAITMTIKKNYKELETLQKRGKRQEGQDVRRGSYRYRERLVEEEEAEEQIKQYKRDEEIYEDNDSEIQNNLR